jgi:hypothetical protein
MAQARALAEDQMLITISQKVTIAANLAATDFHDAT